MSHLKKLSDSHVLEGTIRYSSQMISIYLIAGHFNRYIIIRFVNN